MEDRDFDVLDNEELFAKLEDSEQELDDINNENDKLSDNVGEDFAVDDLSFLDNVFDESLDGEREDDEEIVSASDCEGYRIISLEAKHLYAEIQNNGEYKLPTTKKEKDERYYKLFKNVLDYSLDLIELESIYYDKCRKKFSFEDESNNKYTLAIVNLKFNSGYKENNDQADENLDADEVILDKKTKNAEGKSLKELREYFYENGFTLGGAHYVRYKRSSGSSRQGKCLFIDERLYKDMSKWGECGLKRTKDMDLASWEAYKALSLSALKGLVKIPLEGILVVPDYTSKFEEKVISVESVYEEIGIRKKKEKVELIADRKITEIKNDIWDGESLLDESVFENSDYAKKHMLLLRNKFFKSCAFRTKLQKWFVDKNVTSVEELKKRGFVTLANDISQIVMVTTPNSMKFLKFMKGGLTENNLRSWTENVDENFGVVKYDKRTRFLGGKMVQTSYQFLNTLNLTYEQAEKLLEPTRKYIELIRNDIDFMRYHFEKVYKREKEAKKEKLEDVDVSFEGQSESDSSGGLAERSEVIFKLMRVNDVFQNTRLYVNFRNEVVENQKNRLKEGHILLPGTNATLFGNGPELLYALSGEFDMSNPNNRPMILDKGQVRCLRFESNKKLVCARSPHITMGNLYLVTNKTENEIWDYFDLGDNIVCVNAIGENIQQRLNGCDYDSDLMLITDDKLIVDVVEEQDKQFDFLVPVCNIPSTKKKGQELAELDYNTSENQIGQIVNLSQKLNSFLWDKINWKMANKEALDDQYNAPYDAKDATTDELYNDICKLAVLSGIEIDKAKRAYDVSAGSEISRMTKKYGTRRPEFFKIMDNKEIEKRVRYVHYTELDEDIKFLREEIEELKLNRKKAIQAKDDQLKAKYEADIVDRREQLERKNGLKKAEEKILRQVKRKELEDDRTYHECDTAMEFIYKIASEISFDKGKDKIKRYARIIDLINKPDLKDISAYSTNYKHKDKAVVLDEEYNNKISKLYREINMSDEDEKELLYQEIESVKKERKEELDTLLDNKYVLYLILKDYEKRGSENWRVYAPYLESKALNALLKKSKTQLKKVIKDENGEYEIYGQKFTKK